MAEAFYAGLHDWTQTTPTKIKLSVAISSDMLALLPSLISLMFLNDATFASDGIAMLPYLLTHLKPSSNENLLLAISDLACLEMPRPSTSGCTTGCKQHQLTDNSALPSARTYWLRSVINFINVSQ